MPPVNIVLIDLDGTISDSSPGMLTGFRKVFDRFDMEQPSDESIRRHFGPPLAVTWRDVYGMTDEQILVGLEVYREYYHDIGMFENNLYDGVPELIKDLHGEGVTLSTATSKPASARLESTRAWWPPPRPARLLPAGGGQAGRGGAPASPIPTDPLTATLRRCSKSSFVFFITYIELANGPA